MESPAFLPKLITTQQKHIQICNLNRGNHCRFFLLDENAAKGYPHFFSFCEYFFPKNFSNKKILINIV